MQIMTSSPSMLKQQRPFTLPRHPQIVQKLLTDLLRRPRITRAKSVRVPLVHFGVSIPFVDSQLRIKTCLGVKRLLRLAVCS